MTQSSSSISSRKSLLTRREEVELCRLIKAGDEADSQLEALNCLNTANKHPFKVSSQGDTELDNKSKASEASPPASKVAQKPVSPEKLKKLLAASEEGRTALGTFVEANMGLVIHLAQRYQNKGISIEDLIQEGYLALIQATHFYDPDKGYRFSSYASSWICFEMIKAVKKQTQAMKMSDAQIKKMTRLNKVYFDLDTKFSRPPTAGELSKELGISLAEVQKMLKVRTSHLSLEYEMGSGTTLGDTIEYAQDLLASDAILEMADMQKVYFSEISRAMSELSESEREVLKMRFGLNGRENLSLKETADELSKGEGRKVTQAAVRHLEEKALRKLRSIFPDIVEDLDSFIAIK